MNKIQFNPQKLSIMPIVSHIKIPSLEINAQGEEILKAKKININPPQTKSRSLSAHSNFRKIFKVQKAQKENSMVANTNSIEKMREARRISKKCENPKDIRFLNEICQQVAKENLMLRHKIEIREGLINKAKSGKAVVPKIFMGGQRFSPLRVPVKVCDKIDDLITFRPEASPKKIFHFPKDFF